MRDFITDRTQADVDRCSELLKKGYGFVAMESKEELGIMERFMWINGYVAKGNNLLVKELKEQE